MLFLEPESIEWAHFSDGGNGGLVPLSFDTRLRSFARSAGAGDAVATQVLVDHLIAQSVSYNPGIDLMVAQAREQIRPATSQQTDHTGGVGKGRSSFAQPAGTPLPGDDGLPAWFFLWCRLRAAAEIAMRGSSLTEAAHAAGFADSAHLSRTFRSMFGIAPSFLFRRGHLDVTFLETAVSI